MNINIKLTEQEIRMLEQCIGYILDHNDEKDISNAIKELIKIGYKTL